MTDYKFGDKVFLVDDHKCEIRGVVRDLKEHEGKSGVAYCS